MIYRQGDVIIKKIKTIPDDAVKSKEVILAQGETTGHAHRINNPSTAKLFVTPKGLIFVRVTAPAEIYHEEHESIMLPMGDYKVNQQREFDWLSEETRKVSD